MSVDIGPKIGIDGEKEFRDELRNINQQLRTLGSEMKAVTSAFDANAESQDRLSAQAQVLTNQIDAQEKKLQQLQKGLDASAEKYGKNDTRTLRWAQAVQDATAELNRMRTQLSQVESQLGGTESKYDNLTRKISDQERELSDLRREHTNAVLTYGKTSREAQDLARQIGTLSAELKESKTAMSQAEKATSGLKTALDEAGDSTGGILDSVSGLMGDMGLGGVAGILGKGFAVGAVVSGVSQLTGAITGLVDETAEYRKIMGTLETSSQAAGYTAEQTAAEYQLLYSVLGDNQTAATATANLQAIGLSQKDLITITNQAIGAWATYGDSIPIDSLAESINETIRAGTVTGTFADVLNWGSQEGETFGVTMRESTEANKEWNDAVAACETAEDYFNLALQDCQTQAERADLVMQAMANQGLRESADAWKENNEDIIDTNTSQAEFEEAQARLAEKLTPVKDALTDLGTLGFNFLAGTVDTVSTAVEDLIGWWDDLMDKIQKGWKDFWGIEEGSRDMSSRGTGFVDGSHAQGLDYVPFDGYIAQLHRGEMVIPAREASMLREAYGHAASSGVSIERTINNAAAGMVNGLSALGGLGGNIRVEIPVIIDGKEFYRYTIDDLRAVQRANPEVVKT